MQKLSIRSLFKFGYRLDEL